MNTMILDFIKGTEEMLSNVPYNFQEEAKAKLAEHFSFKARDKEYQELNNKLSSIEKVMTESTEELVKS